MREGRYHISSEKKTAEISAEKNMTIVRHWFVVGCHDAAIDYSTVRTSTRHAA